MNNWIFVFASYCTDPFCFAHEQYWFGKAIKKVPWFKVMILGFCGIVLALVGVLFRFLGILYMPRPFLSYHKSSDSKEKEILSFLL